MSWEQRGSQQYYYRVKRGPNGQLVKTYVGTGPPAQRAAQEDHQKRTQRDTARREKQEWEALDTQVATLDRLMTLLSHSTLADAGFYKHRRGEWRTRRNNGKHVTEISPEPE